MNYQTLKVFIQMFSELFGLKPLSQTTEVQILLYVADKDWVNEEDILNKILKFKYVIKKCLFNMCKDGIIFSRWIRENNKMVRQYEINKY